MSDNDNRTMNEYSGYLRDGSWYAHAHEYNAKEMSYLILGLCGESGEFADEFKKVVRAAGFDDKDAYDEIMHEGFMIKLRDELGDVLWYVTSLCRVLGITLEQLMLRNAHKLYIRYKADGDFYPNQVPVTWAFTNPMHSVQNMENARDIESKFWGGTYHVRVDEKI